MHFELLGFYLEGLSQSIITMLYTVLHYCRIVITIVIMIKDGYNFDYFGIASNHFKE